MWIYYKSRRSRHNLPLLRPESIFEPMVNLSSSLLWATFRRLTYRSVYILPASIRLKSLFFSVYFLLSSTLSFNYCSIASSACSFSRSFNSWAATSISSWFPVKPAFLMRFRISLAFCYFWLNFLLILSSFSFLSRLAIRYCGTWLSLISSLSMNVPSKPLVSWNSF